MIIGKLTENAKGKGGIMLTELFHNALTSINNFIFHFDIR